MKRITFHLGSHPLALIACVSIGIGLTTGWFLADIQRANSAEAVARNSQRTIAAEDIGRRCVLNLKPLNECVAACSAVDGWFDQSCANAARRTVLGDAGPAKIRPAPKVAVVAAELDGGPQR